MGNSFFDRVIKIEVVDQQSGKTVVIDSLDIEFTVEKSVDGNTATVKIFNCSKETINRISGNKKSISIIAGYEKSQAIIYVGDIIHTEENNEAADKYILLECQTGVISRNESTVSVSFKENIGAKDVLAKIVDSFKGTKKPELSTSGVTDKKLLGGFSFSGKSSDAMNKIADELGVVWTNQDNKIKVYQRPKGDGSKVVVLDSDSGLIGTPKKIQKTDTGGTGTGETYEARALLLSRVEIGGIVSIRSSTVNKNNMVVSKVVHRGSFSGNDFCTTITVDGGAQ